uniref:Uncharacterized protein n=1 Tax=Siphoviridae sp. ctLmu1 TaxID=2826253 RepID=A0A8S5NH61_9CAUD|nr:MAG TPA: hypothetical protein [Siphoviridae sp. ctLmu1]
MEEFIQEITIECCNESRQTKIPEQKKASRVDKLNSRSSHGNF